VRRFTRLIAVLGVLTFAMLSVVPTPASADDFSGFSRQNLYDDPESDGLRRGVAPDSGVAAPAGTGDGKRIVYTVRGQRVWLIEATGTVSRTYRVSGRAGTPRTGTYSVFSKSPTSSSGSVTMRYMVRFAHGQRLAIGFHTIPRTSSGKPIQSTSELGSYRSHGCVRQADSDALALWNFAPIGTKVVVI
jgi:lipoprotein-anchoring transpeptidase ErfK/SrfK